MTLVITHTPTEGTLIDGTAKGDGSNEVLKANGWRWSRNLSCWYVRHSRDKQPSEGRIQHTAEALRQAGFEVEVHLDFTTRPTAEVEADKADRAAARAEALTEKAERKAADAEAAYQSARQAGDALPEGGEPIKVGHHSERRHRKAMETAHNRMGKAVAASIAADRVAHRSETAQKATERRYSTSRVANRIQHIKTDLRAVKRDLEGRTIGAGSPYAEVIPPASGSRKERLEARKAGLSDDLAYWISVRKEQIERGKATDFTREDIAAGDLIRYGGLWSKVARVNPKTVTVYLTETEAVTSSYRPRYDQIQEVRKLN